MLTLGTEISIAQVVNVPPLKDLGLKGKSVAGLAKLFSDKAWSKTVNAMVNWFLASDVPKSYVKYKACIALGVAYYKYSGNGVNGMIVALESANDKNNGEQIAKWYTGLAKGAATVSKPALGSVGQSFMVQIGLQVAHETSVMTMDKFGYQSHGFQSFSKYNYSTLQSIWQSTKATPVQSQKDLVTHNIKRTWGASEGVEPEPDPSKPMPEAQPDTGTPGYSIFNIPGLHPVFNKPGLNPAVTDAMVNQFKMIPKGGLPKGSTGMGTATKVLLGAGAGLGLLKLATYLFK